MTFGYRYFLIALVLLLAGCHNVRQDSRIDKGVSRELAEQRKAVISGINYTLWFDIPEISSEKIEGRVNIGFRLKTPRQVILDFRESPESVKEVKVNGQVITAEVVNEHILLPGKYLRSEENLVEIRFIAGDQSLNRNEDYLYTLLVPDRARTLFPCFDQPDLKATYSLELNIPEKWVAVANGPLEKEEVRGDRKQVKFITTPPLSTYLFSFVAGRWEKITETREGQTITLYHRETAPEKLSQTGVIFDQVFGALKWMEEYTGVPYPFQKYDMVIVPGFQFGGMEHPGAVLYNDNQMFLSEHPAIGEELRRMQLISHETAHMWFGDDVTMAWFDDVWTKEVFANYFAGRMTEPVFLEVDHRLNALRNFFPAAYSEDRTLGTTAIRQPLDNLNNAGLIYGQIVYNKAPVMMTMLVERIGEENFRKGIQEYLHTYSYNNATWDALIAILDRYTPEDLVAWSRVWVDEKGRPEISAACENGQLIIRDKDPWNRNLSWPQQLDYALVRKPKDGRSCYEVEHISVGLEDALVTVNVKPDVEYIIPNINGKGYGYFVLDSASLAFCLQNPLFFTDPVTRLSVMLTLYENYMNGRIPVNDFTKAMFRYLENEPEPLISAMAVAYLKDACLHQRPGSKDSTERAWYQLIKTEGRPDTQQAAFRALLEVWTLPEITCEIAQLWKHQKKIEGLQINERDEMKMAYELSIRLPEECREIVELQSNRITNPDRKREFNFVARALAADTLTRDSLFNVFLLPENRKMEPWVAQVLYYLNHPLREKQAIKYIYPALCHLQEIQQTGDIFFPKNWLSSTLRGHTAPEAEQVVRQFLEDYPGYPTLLKNKILQSADHLYRR